MNTLWIFGDSFVSPLNKSYDKDYFPDYAWTKQLANKLNLNLRIEALPGVSNQWISIRIKEYFDKIEQSDSVIVVTTQPNRHWIIKDLPRMSNIFQNNFQKYITKKQYTAITSYVAQFADRHDFLSQIHYEWFLQWCRSTLSDKSKLCLIPGFDSTRLHDVCNSASLFDIDQNEFGDRKNQGMYDKRINHLSEVNHNVLAYKVENFFKNNEGIDLDNGFHKNFL